VIIGENMHKMDKSSLNNPEDTKAKLISKCARRAKKPGAVGNIRIIIHK
jgi:hypothetical protein